MAMMKFFIIVLMFNIVHIQLIYSQVKASVNLIKNPTFIENGTSIEDWVVKAEKGWSRKEIVAFQGQPDSMYYLTGRHKALISQKSIKVKRNTWYSVSITVCNRLAPSPDSGGNLWLGVLPEHPKTQYDYLHCAHFGALNNWHKVQMFFNSGNNNTTQLDIRFFGKGEWMFGRCELRKVRDSDFKRDSTVDGNFEDGLPGFTPFNCWSSNTYSPPEIATNGNFFIGKQSLRIDLSSGKGINLRGPGNILAKPGSRIKVAFWAKSDIPNLNLLCEINRMPGDNNNRGTHWRSTRGLRVTKKWGKMEFEVMLPKDGKHFLAGTQLLRVAILGEYKRDKSSLVWIDDLRITEELPFKKGQSKKSGLKNLLYMNSSFESGFSGWDWRFTQNIMDKSAMQSGGKVSIDTTTAAEGRCSLRFDIPENYQHTTKNIRPFHSSYGARLYSAFFAGSALETYTVSFWAKANINAEMLVSLPAWPATHSKKLTISDKWHRYSVVITPKFDVHGQMMVKFLLLDSGSYWLDGIQVEKGDKLTAYEPSGTLEAGGVIAERLYPYYTKGETPEVVVYLCSREKKEHSFRFTQISRDWRGNIVDKKTKTVIIPPEQTLTFKTSLYAEQCGTFITEFKILNSVSGESGSSPLIYGIFPKPLVLSNPEDSWCGLMMTNFNADHPTGLGVTPGGYLILRGGTLNDLFKQLPRMGVRWIRNFPIGSWTFHEPEPEKWRWLDSYVDTAIANGLKILPVIGSAIYKPSYNMPFWAWSDKQAPSHSGYLDKKVFYPRMDLWKRFVKEYVKHYGDRIDVFEVLNETGGFAPKPYVELVKVAQEAAREVNPKFRIAAPSYPCHQIPYDDQDNTWVGKVLKAGVYSYLDIYCAHFYLPNNQLENYVNRYGTLEESLGKRMNFLRNTYGTKPVWDTESGVPALPITDWLWHPAKMEKNLTREDEKWYTPELAAARCVRWIIMKRAAGIDKIFRFRMSGGPLCNGTTYDLVGNDMSPKPITVSYAQAARRLTLAKFKEKITVGESLWIYSYEVSGRSMTVFWDFEKTGSKAGKIFLNIAADDITVEDLMGNIVLPVKNEKGIVLPLTDSPVYVLSDKLSRKEILEKFKNGKIIAPVDLSMQLSIGNKGTTPALVAGIHNKSTRAIDIAAKVSNLPDGWVVDGNNNVDFKNVLPGEKQVVFTPLTKVPPTEAGKKIKISTEKDGLLFQNESRGILLAEAKKVQSQITIDGNISEEEYAHAPTLNINKSNQVVSRRKELWAGKEKSNAKAKLLWDQNALYIGIKIMDNKVINDADKRELWLGDCVEIYLDTDTGKDIFINAINSHQGKIICAPAYSDKGARIAVSSLKESIYGVDHNKIEVASKKTKQGYNIEIKIPIIEKKMYAGRIWGFDLSFIDDDGDKHSRCQLMWTGRKSWSKPHNYGFIIFTDKVER
jgi:cellulose/xylan binding protein with CBM9 domain